MSQKSSARSSSWYSPAVASTAAPLTPPRASTSASAGAVVISSHGLNALNSVGSSSPTDLQKTLDAGSHQSGPQVVIASIPPGRTSRHISAANAGMSATKNTPNTHTTASN